MSYQCIDQDRAVALMENENAQVVDIRDPASYASGRIVGAVHISNENIGEFLQQADKSRPLIVCCYHGNSSKGAADYLANQGFDQSYSLDGGFTAWQQAGLAAES